MARAISLELARLIRERAYAAGDLKKEVEKAKILRLALEDAETECIRAQAVLKKIDEKLGNYPSIKPTLIRSIEAHPRRVELTHGAFTRELIRFLRTARRPVSTSEVIEYQLRVFDLEEGSTGEERKWFRNKTSKRLRVMSDKGVIQRLHERKTTKLGLWLWIGG
jgi:hypothetical protein